MNKDAAQQVREAVEQSWPDEEDSEAAEGTTEPDPAGTQDDQPDSAQTDEERPDETDDAATDTSEEKGEDEPDEESGPEAEADEEGDESDEDDPFEEFPDEELTDEEREVKRQLKAAHTRSRQKDREEVNAVREENDDLRTRVEKLTETVENLANKPGPEAEESAEADTEGEDEPDFTEGLGQIVTTDDILNATEDRQQFAETMQKFVDQQATIKARQERHEAERGFDERLKPVQGFISRAEQQEALTKVQGFIEEHPDLQPSDDGAQSPRLVAVRDYMAGMREAGQQVTLEQAYGSLFGQQDAERRQLTAFEMGKRAGNRPAEQSSDEGEADDNGQRDSVKQQLSVPSGQGGSESTVGEPPQRGQSPRDAALSAWDKVVG